MLMQTESLSPVVTRGPRELGRSTCQDLPDSGQRSLCRQCGSASSRWPRHWRSYAKDSTYRRQVRFCGSAPRHRVRNGGIADMCAQPRERTSISFILHSHQMFHKHLDTVYAHTCIYIQYSDICKFCSSRALPARDQRVSGASVRRRGDPTRAVGIRRGLRPQLAAK